MTISSTVNQYLRLWSSINDAVDTFITCQSILNLILLRFNYFFKNNTFFNVVISFKK